MARHHFKNSVKIFRRFFRRYHYIHPNKRHILLITICFWLSGITLWTFRAIHDEPILVINSVNTNPYYATIESWHKNDSILPKLFPSKTSKWKYYPKSELFAWHEVPLHSVRALVNNNKTYLG